VARELQEDRKRRRAVATKTKGGKKTNGKKATKSKVKQQGRSANEEVTDCADLGDWKLHKEGKDGAGRLREEKNMNASEEYRRRLSNEGLSERGCESADLEFARKKKTAAVAAKRNGEQAVRYQSTRTLQNGLERARGALR
jgi:hypothetical protein